MAGWYRQIGAGIYHYYEQVFGRTVCGKSLSPNIQLTNADCEPQCEDCQAILATRRTQKHITVDITKIV